MSTMAMMVVMGDDWLWLRSFVFIFLFKFFSYSFNKCVLFQACQKIRISAHFHCIFNFRVWIHSINHSRLLLLLLMLLWAICFGQKYINNYINKTSLKNSIHHITSIIYWPFGTFARMNIEIKSHSVLYISSDCIISCSLSPLHSIWILCAFLR